MLNLINDLEITIKKTILNVASDDVAIAFSGGIDSSIIALLAKNSKKPILYTVGTKNSYDIKYAKTTADMIGLPIKEIIIGKNEIEDAIPKISNIIETTNVVTISYELPLYFVAEKADEEILLTGQGADELFGGYSKYLDIDMENLNKVLERDVKELRDGILEKKIAQYFKKKLYLPFLDPKFVDIALQIPVEFKIRGETRKYILRELGRSLGLPEVIVQRKKKAAQYSSGIMKTIKSLAKKNGTNTENYVKTLI